jgi:hypothetical protein
LTNKIGDIESDGVGPAIGADYFVLDVERVSIFELFDSVGAIEAQFVITLKYNILIRGFMAVKTDDWRAHNGTKLRR